MGWKMRVRLLPFFLLTCLTAMASETDGATKISAHKFAPVTFSIGCSSTTRADDKRGLKRSPQAVGYFQERECVDAARQLGGVKLVSVAITENERLGLFEVVLKLDPAAASNLAHLTDRGNPQPLVLSVKGLAVVAGYNQAPFHGDTFHISADTLDDARKTADLFDD